MKYMVGLTILEEMGHSSLKISDQEYENGQTQHPHPVCKFSFHKILASFKRWLPLVCEQISNFFEILQIFPNRFQFDAEFLFLKYCNFFSKLNWIRFGIFSGLKCVFLFPNRIQFGLENVIDFFKIYFPNRIGIGWETDTV